jgi:uncharacterized secreted protein with C-terminal beta-propeller domain
LSSKSWNYRDSYIKRALWIGDNVYSISDDKIKSSDIENWSENKSVNLK